MKTPTLIGTAFGNTLRSKMRTALTVIAIFIGAFALTLTSGIGAGVNRYVENVVAGFGSPNQLYVMPGPTAQTQAASTPEEGPAPYDPDASPAAGGPFGGAALTDEDLEAIRGIEHVTSVEPVEFISADYIESPDGDQWTVSQLGFPFETGALELEAGEVPDAEAFELTVPEDWVQALGGERPEDVVGTEVTLGVTDAAQQPQTVTAVVSGVSLPAVSGTGGSPVPSSALAAELAEVIRSGLPQAPEVTYVQAVATVDDLAANEQAVKTALTEQDLMGMSLEDQLGAVQGILNVVVWILNGFGLIALLAASFGIVNTLLMSVQERTREIGLMKALGMTSGKVFGLFSLEAVLIGVMGSVLGIGLGVAVGLIAQQLLLAGPFADVTGLQVFGVDPLALLGILGLILAIAFLAGTLPAARAARKDPIASLRYE